MFIGSARYIVAMLVAAVAMVLLSCDTSFMSEPVPWEGLQAPPGFEAVPFPKDNEPTLERIELGRRLFFDTRLSRDFTVSCASCHRPELAFADDRTVSTGVENRLGTRNAPSLMNVAYQPYLLREGSVPTLEMQALVPVQEHHEFDMNMVELVARLSTVQDYRERAERAYGRKLDAFVLTRALATYERSLLSRGSAYDRYELNGDVNALTASAKRGKSLFEHSGRCATCHAGPNFTSYEFANIGLYKVYADEGRKRATGEERDLGMFKIPSLRNVALTAPYMHDGSIKTLKEVVQHYAQGGKGHMNQSRYVRRLSLTDAEVDDIVAFLEALTDEGIVR